MPHQWEALPSDIQKRPGEWSPRLWKCTTCGAKVSYESNFTPLPDELITIPLKKEWRTLTCEEYQAWQVSNQ